MKDLMCRPRPTQKIRIGTCPVSTMLWSDPVRNSIQHLFCDYLLVRRGIARLWSPRPPNGDLLMWHLAPYRSTVLTADGHEYCVLRIPSRPNN